MPIQQKERISASQFVFLVAGYTIGTSVLLLPGGGNQNNWQAILLGMIEGLLFALIYLALANRFPGKTLVEICDLVWGPYLGKLFSILFLLYVFHLGALVVGDEMDFVRFAVLPLTPSLAAMIPAVLVCALAASSGLEVLGRVTAALFIPVIAISLVSDLMLFPQYKLENFLPFLDLPFPEFLKHAHGAASFPFGETAVFLMIIPFLNQGGKPRRSMIAGLILGGVFLVLASLRNTAVLGASMPYYLYPSYSAIRLIDVGDIFTRLEIIMGINFLSTIFIKLSLIIYVLMLGAAQLLKLKSYRSLTIPVWLLITLFGVHNYTCVAENFEFANKVYPIYSLPFEVGLPLFTLIAALIRKLPREGSQK